MFLYGSFFNSLYAITDSVQLNEITIIDSKQSDKIGRYSFSNLDDYGAKRLTSLLNDLSGIYLKNYGNGQLTTLAVRGTSASQTEVLWNGVRINSPMLGQSDLSLLSAGFHNKLSLQYNTIDAAIGANLQLINEPEKVTGAQFNGAVRAGSFGLFEAILQAKYGIRSFNAATKFIIQKCDNNFRLPDIAVNKKQPNAAILQWSLFQEFNLNLKKQHALSAFIWYTQAERELPPTIFQRTSKASQDDASLRLQLRYKWNSSFWNLQIASTYVMDKLRYINPAIYTDDFSVSHAFRNLVTLGFKKKQFHINAKLTADYERAMSDGYGGTKSRPLGGINAEAGYYFIKPRIQTRIGVRQEIMKSIFSPFMPFISANINRPFGNHIIAAEVTAKRSFRFPTLNDLYWVNAGNPRLKPEDAWNGELILKYAYHSYFTISASNYYIYVTDWIQWTPDENGNWTPSNIKKVFSRGAEINMQLRNGELNPMKFHVQLEASYCFTKTTQLSAGSGNDRAKDKQLIYVPVHKFTSSVTLAYRNFYLRPIVRYTGLRFISTDNSSYLPAYLLMDIEAGKAFNFNKNTFALSIRVNNMTNKSYQDIASRAMPMRNFEACFKMNIQ